MASFVVPNSVSVGSPIAAAQWNLMVANFSLMNWQTYTATIGATTTAPTVGAGSILGRYAQVGHTVHVKFDVTFGSGMTAGSGGYLFGLPLTASTADVLFGHGRLFDSSSGNGALVGANLSTSTSVGLQYAATTPTGTLSTVGAAAPWVWASGDLINISLTYEAA